MNRTYIVGRSPEADIQIPRDQDSVGKMHLELTVLSDGSVCVTDRRSANGTSVRSRDGWTQIRGTQHVQMDAELKLGDFRTTVRDLLAQAAPRRGGGKAISVEPVDIRRYPADPGTQHHRPRH